MEINKKTLGHYLNLKYYNHEEYLGDPVAKNYSTENNHVYGYMKIYISYYKWHW